MAITFGEPIKNIKNKPDDLSKFDGFYNKIHYNRSKFSGLLDLLEIEKKSYRGSYHIVSVGKVKDKEGKTVVFNIQMEMEWHNKYVSFKVFNFIDNKKIMDSPYLQKVLLYLMAPNQNTKMGRWVLNPLNGDLYIDCSIAIQIKSDVTPTQVYSMRDAVISKMLDSYDDIKRILETGVNHSIPNEDVIKNIIYELTIHNKLDLIPKLLEEQDFKKVYGVYKLILNRDFEAASKILQPVDKIALDLFGPKL